jgi:hypothetical protein
VALEVKSKNSTIGVIFLWLSGPEEAFTDPVIKLETEDEPRIQSQITKSREQALAAFLSRKVEGRRLLDRPGR